MPFAKPIAIPRQTEVESWRHLQSQNIEFTMKRLRPAASFETGCGTYFRSKHQETISNSDEAELTKLAWFGAALLTYHDEFSAIRRLARSLRLREDVGFREGAFTMKTLRTLLIAVATMTMVSCAAFAQVTVITPDSEHVYSSDPARPQQLPDDKTLQLQNERAERERIAREREEADQAASSESQSPNTYQPPTSAWGGVYQPPTSAWDSPNYQPPKSGWADR